MKGDPKLTRRSLLKLAAALGGAGALAELMRDVGLAGRGPSPPPNTGAGKAARPVRSWAMVVDLRKCDGCVTIDEPPQCTQACIKEHYVPQGQQWIQVYEHPLPGGGMYFMATPCFQCENAPCAKVCPVGATYHNREGIVLIDHERCIGCRLCMAACPYQRRFFNWGQPQLPPEARLARYSPEYPVPAIRGTVIKCMFCAHRAQNGKLPACVEGCPMNALYFGDLEEDVATNGVEVVKLSRFLSDNNAYRYKEELGTKPRVWYIPGHGQAYGRHSQDKRKARSQVWREQGEAIKTVAR